MSRRHTRSQGAPEYQADDLDRLLQHRHSPGAAAAAAPDDDESSDSSTFEHVEVDDVAGAEGAADDLELNLHEVEGELGGLLEEEVAEEEDDLQNEEGAEFLDAAPPEDDVDDGDDADDPPPQPGPAPAPFIMAGVGAGAAAMQALLNTPPVGADGAPLANDHPRRIRWQAAVDAAADKAAEAEQLLAHLIVTGEQLTATLEARVGAAGDTLANLQAAEHGTVQFDTLLGQLVYQVENAEQESRDAAKAERQALAELAKANLPVADNTARKGIIDDTFARSKDLGMEVKVLKTQLQGVQRDMEQAGKNFKPKSVEVKKFNGDKQADYFSFKNHYRTTYGRMGLTDAQRFHYLLDHLEKEPLTAVKSLPIADASYARAWAILDGHFGDERTIKNQLLEDLSRTSFRQDGQPLELRKFHDEVDNKYRRLLEVDGDLAHQHGTLLPLMEKIYPYQLRKDMLTRLGRRANTVREFLDAAAEIIQEEVQLRGIKYQKDSSSGGKKPPFGKKSSSGNNNQAKNSGKGGSMAGFAGTLSDGSKKGKSPPPSTGGGNGGGKKKKGKKSGSSPSSAGGGSGAKTRACLICKGDHNLPQCESLKKMTNADRRETVGELKLCFVCFSPKHFAKDCKAKQECRVKVNGQRCGSTSHHTLLHPAQK